MAIIVVKDILDVIGEEYVRLLKEEIKANNKIDSGSLYNSVYYQINGNQLRIQANNYLKYVDEGRRRNSTPPPISAMLNIGWVKQLATKSERLSAAFAMSKKIARDGIRPTYILDNVSSKLNLDKTEEYLYKNLNSGINEMIIKYNTK